MDCLVLSNTYHERGFLIVEDFFSQMKIDEMDRELARYIDNMQHTGADQRVVFEPGPERRLRNIFDMQHFDGYFAELAKTAEFFELAKTIFDDEPLLMSVELFAKPARVGTEVPYHQDNAYFNLVPDQALTIWLALADATEENGCMRYIEGSHRFGTLPHRRSGVKGNSMGLAEVPADAGREVCGIVRRGGALIHHCNTIHRSEPNHSSHDRPGLLFVYKAARCRVDEARAANYRQIAATV